LSRIRRTSIAIAAAAASLAIWAPAAPAANVILGSQAPGAIIGGFIPPQASTVSQLALPGAVVASPVDGVIVRWQFSGAEAGEKFSLRVLGPKGGRQFLGAGRGPEVTAAGTGLETFPAALPIRAGQLIGIDMEANARIAAAPTPSAETLSFRPPLAEGTVTTAAVGPPSELGFNAEVQPLPRIAAITPGSGPVGGGNSVVISGTDLLGASAVSFNAVPALSFRVDSEGQITAVAPPSAAPGTVPVSVRTLAGTATSSAEYAYVADSSSGGGAGGGAGGGGAGGARCVVPKLKGLRPKAAKKRLRKANCRIGKVRRKGGASAAKGRVLRQFPERGQVAAPGTRVNVLLR
jgi:hypothetical protein